MRYLDVCAGISASSVAWKPLGWEAAAYSEIEPAPRAILEHRQGALPVGWDHRHAAGSNTTPLFGDFTQIEAHHVGPIDLLVGGTPCQDFSVAGLRAGLDGDRGNLSLEFLRLADRTRPRWVVWENVPGVLSINGGRAFGAILGGLGELGYGFAYRVLDAQHFGVPQRRRRVFVVGYLGDWRRAAAVLLERHSLSGHSAPSRKARKDITGRVARSLAIRGRDGAPHAELGDELANAILTPSGGRAGIGVGAALIEAFGGGNCSGPIDVAACLVAKGQKCDFEVETFIAEQAGTLAAGGNSSGGNRYPGMSADTADTMLIAHALRGEGFDASEDGTGRGTPLVPVSFQTRGSNLYVGDEAGTLGTNSGSASGAAPCIAFDCKASGQNGFGVGEVMSTLRSMGHANSHTNGGGHASVQYGSAVRRLTPRECERLQGFPDDYTLVTNRGRPMADGPRYKALGNSMAVPVMRWIGGRIAAVDAMPLEQRDAA